MLQAKYRNGRDYHAGTFWQVNLRQFVVHDLVELRVGTFVWDKWVHGYPLFHFLRNAISGEPRHGDKCYILVTDLWKIFVYSDGRYELRRDWVPNHAIYHEPVIPRALIS
jgi:hypothetical protein